MRRAQEKRARKLNSLSGNVKEMSPDFEKNLNVQNTLLLAYFN